MASKSTRSAMKKKSSLGRVIFRWTGLFAALTVLVGLFVFVVTYILLPIPKPSDLA